MVCHEIEEPIEELKGSYAPSCRLQRSGYFVGAVARHQEWLTAVRKGRRSVVTVEDGGFRTIRGIPVRGDVTREATKEANRGGDEGFLSKRWRSRKTDCRNRKEPRDRNRRGYLCMKFPKLQTPRETSGSSGGREDRNCQNTVREEMEVWRWRSGWKDEKRNKEETAHQQRGNRKLDAQLSDGFIIRRGAELGN